MDTSLKIKIEAPKRKNKKVSYYCMWNVASVPGSSSEILSQVVPLKSVPKFGVCVHSPGSQCYKQ